MPERILHGLARHRSTIAAGMVSLALALWWIATLEVQKTWGWDESMHAELPAVRLLLLASGGDFQGFFEVLHTCVQYPFGWPLVLAAAQAIFGVSEFVCRVAGILAWGGVIFGTFLLAQEVGRAGRQDGEGPAPGEDLFPWLALVFTALSPLGLGYAQSLFLEVPFALCTVFSLRAWLRRSNRHGEPGEWLRHLAAGAWLTAAFFTKFNYGILLIFGCGLDGLAGLFCAWRRADLWAEARRLAIALSPLALGLLWWLVWPIPLGLQMGEHHRQSMWAFLGSNQTLVGAPAQQRALFWLVFLSYTGRLFILQFVGALSSLRSVFQPGARLLWLVFLGAGIPVWTHNFQLDRFLLPNAPVLWTLAALGLSGLISKVEAKRAIVLVVLALSTLLFPSKDALWVGERLGLVPEEGSGREYVQDILRSKHQLGSGRRFWTPGLSPDISRQLLDLIAAEVGDDESVAWIGNPSEMSPAALHLGLLAKSANRDRFLRDAHLPLDVTFTGEDPLWTTEQLRTFIQRFDVVITTDPPDLGNRSVRAFIRGYAGKLVDPLGWSAKVIGEIVIPKSVGPPLPFTVYSLRPPRVHAGQTGL